jgi:hypothetical protein
VSKSGEKWEELGHHLKMELQRFANGLRVKQLQELWMIPLFVWPAMYSDGRVKKGELGKERMSKFGIKSSALLHM